MNNAKGIIQDEVYFITTTVVNWIDIFTRPKYKHIVLESLDYCRQHKGLRIYAWVLMSNHLHAIVRSESDESVADIMRDFKKHTSKRIIAELQDDMQETRADGYVATRLMCRLICNLPEYNIRIFNPLASYC